jgi:hypothetical protein
MIRILPALVLALILSSAAPPAAAGPAEDWAALLRAEGYAQIVVRRSLLGRIWIIATGPDGTREVVIDPFTGEVLRDFTTSTRYADRGRDGAAGNGPAPAATGAGGGTGVASVPPDPGDDPVASAAPDSAP